MTDPGMADRTYVGPMTPELVEQILAKVGKAAHQRHVGVLAAALLTLSAPLLRRNAPTLSCQLWAVRLA